MMKLERSERVLLTVRRGGEEEGEKKKKKPHSRHMKSTNWLIPKDEVWIVDQIHYDNEHILLLHINVKISTLIYSVLHLDATECIRK